MNQLNINDIKELETIPDISFYIFILLISIGICLLLSLIYLIYKFFKKEKSDKYFYYNELKNIDFTNSKDSAYKITKFGKELISNDRAKKLYEELIHELQEYKYKKEVKEIDSTVKQKFEIFMDSIDV